MSFKLNQLERIPFSILWKTEFHFQYVKVPMRYLDYPDLEHREVRAVDRILEASRTVVIELSKEDETDRGKGAV